MSEEILKALMQLFAIIAKQDDGVEVNEIEFVRKFLQSQLNDEMVQEYMAAFFKFAGIDDVDEYLKELEQNGDEKKRKLTSVKDSVRILGICKKINKKLTQRQKVVALVRLFELVNADRKFTEQRMAIINTVAEVFNISAEEFKSTETFVVNNESKDLDDSSILIINHQENVCEDCKHITSEELDGSIIILQIKSVDLYFLRYTGSQDIFLNGLGVNSRSIYLFASGSTIKLPKGKPVYYSDVVSHFLADYASSKISFNVNNIEFKFPNGGIGLRDINLSEEHGKLIGIMGASGAGKTTLLNVLTGNESPSEGQVLINGVDLHNEKDKIEGVIGYIPQDDLLIEELTVFENLYYNAKLCFKDKSEEEINALVEKTLSSLGLLERKDLKVGSPLNKTISGGQRKRLNIALELIREPSILLVDEPTSGLSSRDSENVMDLLRELTLKGKLIFVVIHQPSSDIYKMFDKMVILDTGGYLIYYGNPVEAVSYFKKIDAQINSEVGECPTCGNVNPELIFNIIDAKVVDEFGRYTTNRKVAPTKWSEHYVEKIKPELEVLEDEKDDPPKSLNIPQWFNQFKIYTLRDFFSKISNKQYIALNLLESPLLAFILTFLIRYIADPNSRIYIFRENENIPPYVFMSLIVALFLGFMVSAEEIFRDRKILKREAFLNLSRSSYLVSKIIILFVISAIQAFLFVILGNLVLGVHGLFLEYWFALFTTAAFANMLGLNISSAFNSAVTIYILIPLLIIPQMALGGAMFSFDKLNRTIGSVDKVPLVAEFMTTRWTYEAIMVKQYKDNDFEEVFYEIDRNISIADFKQVYYIPELKDRLELALEALNSPDEEVRSNLDDYLELLHNEVSKEIKRVPEVKFELVDYFVADSFSDFVASNAVDYFNSLTDYYIGIYDQANFKKEKIIEYWDNTQPGFYKAKRSRYHNEAVADIVEKTFEKNKIVEYQNRLIQQVDPIFQNPEPKHMFAFRCHFYAPTKHFMGHYFDTFWFNMIFVWILTLILYATLYYDLLKKGMDMFGK
jgi:ABC-type multidrug transport system ATPase subunit